MRSVPRVPAPVDRALSEARSAVDVAYRRARRLVFDRFPPGPVDPDRLDPEQRDALQGLERAEAALERLRRERHPGRTG